MAHKDLFYWRLDSRAKSKLTTEIMDDWQADKHLQHLRESKIQSKLAHLCQSLMNIADPNYPEMGAAAEKRSVKEIQNYAAQALVQNELIEQ